jgi:large subunit ribosomal protein L10e
MFLIRILKYPHNILREHKLATGAGADRVSSGMRGAFGKAVGHAVRAQRGEKLLSVSTTKEHFETAKEALRRAKMKLPAPCKIIVE